ncbi:hypothetical protein EQM14_00770 [Caproiciproducens sp. NJN-50]|uniref:hypothetical protein n=1 Tax=Acutalibacteraceae TaxID=3082771 RepID=UPI000FFE00F5|nr:MULTISPECIES: hypothetical protein [Acutalibacteraceae]QAT48430.1 hypothetical protein EQM14_00770 [Caproiciproducens sp. NJN-50]
MTQLLLLSALLAAGTFAPGFLLFGMRHRESVFSFGKRNYAVMCGLSALLCFAILFLTGNFIGRAESTPDAFLRTGWPILFLEAALFCASVLCVWMLRQMGEFFSGRELYSIMKTACILVALCLFCELFVFNYLSFVPSVKNMSAGSLPLDGAKLENGASFSGGEISIGDNGGSVTFDGVGRTTCCFRIQAKDNGKVCIVKVELRDENMAADFYHCGTYDFSADSARTTVLPVYSAGKLDSVRFVFDDSCAGLRIQGISVNQPGFFFSWGRFLLLSLLAVGTLCIIRKKAWTVFYDRTSHTHNRIIVWLAVLLCFVSVALCNAAGAGKEISYPLRGAPEAYGCYIQQFDAFQKGQLNLDLSVDPKLGAMKNPYDYSARVADGVSFSWDRSYYNGKYYSYFGLTPLFTVYYPYYFLFHSLPADSQAGAILALWAIPFLFLLLRELALRYCKKINLLLFLLGTAAAVFSSMLFMLQISADFYYIAYLSEMLFLCAFLFLIFRSDRESRAGLRAFLLFLGGIAYVLAVGSRPVAALSIVLVLPALLKELLHGEGRISRRLLRLGAFALPVLCGALALMEYNFLRFGSPFEFGTTYQLTIDNMSCNRFSILNLIPAVYHYFLQFPSLDPRFPFLHVVDRQFNYYSSYKLHIVMLGMMSFPSLWWIFGMRRSPVYRERSDARLFFWTVLLLSLGIAVLNYSVSGMDIRYVTDFSPLLSALSLLVILDLNRECARSSPAAGGRSPSYALSCASLILTILVGTAVIFGNERNTIYYTDPAFYANLERLCMFW